MEEYISKSALVAEIERRTDELWELIPNGEKVFSNKHTKEDTFNLGKYTALESLDKFIDTLEVKEEILDKEGKTKLMRKCVHKAYKRGYDMGVLQTTNKMNHNMKEVNLDKELNAMITPELKFHKALPSLFDVAKHFFELGMTINNKVQKEL